MQSAPTVIVVDASVLTVALTDNVGDGQLARDRLRAEDLFAPELIDLEVASALRRMVMTRTITSATADSALAELIVIPLTRASHSALLWRCWELRDNLTIYDSAYVALAEMLGCTFVTADRRLGGAPGIRCPVETLVAAM